MSSSFSFIPTGGINPPVSLRSNSLTPALFFLTGSPFAWHFAESPLALLSLGRLFYPSYSYPALLEILAQLLILDYHFHRKL